MGTPRSIELFGMSWRIFLPRRAPVVAGFRRTARNGAALAPTLELAMNRAVISCRSQLSASGDVTSIRVQIVAALSPGPVRCGGLLPVSPVAARSMEDGMIRGFVSGLCDDRPRDFRFSPGNATKSLGRNSRQSRVENRKSQIPVI